jgi:2-polyprenyl-6-methoxyphenol hydroxylase-like FAD-dependent oxidoreductase
VALLSHVSYLWRRYDRAPAILRGWAKGHVAILGDAAHPMMPNLGQGGCQAVEDAYRLAQVGTVSPFAEPRADN